MSNKGNALISVILIALGVVFIWLYNRDTLPRSIVLLCGLAFVVPAVISLLSIFISRKNNSRSSGLRVVQLVCAIGALVLGGCIIFMPDVFRPLLVYPFAALMVFGGAFQIFQLSHKYRPVDYPAWMFVVPVLVLVTGVVILCWPGLREPVNQPWIVLTTGIAAVVYGANGLLISILPHRLPPLHAASAVGLPDAKHPVEPAKEVVSSPDPSGTVVPDEPAEVGEHRMAE